MRGALVAVSVVVGVGAMSVTGADVMSPLAERYVMLVLAVGQHDPDFVDAYYGPPAWKQQAERHGKQPLGDLQREGEALVAALSATPTSADRLEQLRREYLTAQSKATVTRVRMLSGTRLRFDDESRALYDAVAPTRPEAYFSDALKALDGLVPGPGPLAARVEAFRQRFVIPRDKLNAVFRAAVDACRQQTVAHLQLPAGEQFTIEYVTGKSWSGYNWYQGNYRSLIQVNTDLPTFIDRALDLACHEGYPGHHVYNVLLEHHLVRGRGWQEFTVYPLFSPQSLIAEGTANFGIDVAYPSAARVAFEREHLFALAGLDAAQASKFYDVVALLDRLSYAGNEAARRYLNGDITAAHAVDWLVTYTLSSRERAEQRVRFFDQYRSYVINYNVGKDLVRAYVERQGGTADKPEVRWKVFGDLLSSPRLPSGL
ncbi:MAG: hypothetical protein JJE40_16250 [Vicinamibacteria bacterium]|nr:hypothetical protein [Vicinamibacteria bacterium]